jgi:hypothetical protein
MLGAEVYCETETGYTCWNQIDEVEVMTVSWLLEMPVRKVVVHYG